MYISSDVFKMIMIIMVLVLIVAVLIILLVNRFQGRAKRRSGHAPRKRDVLRDEEREFRERPAYSAKMGLSIGVAGAQHRVGTTTQAIQIALYLLNKRKMKPVVIMMDEDENRENGHDLRFATLLQKCYDDAVLTSDKNVRYRGITIVNAVNLRTIINSDYDAFIYDFGSVTDDSFARKDFITRNVQIVVGGAKPKELLYLRSVLGDRDFTQVRYILSFVPDHDREKLHGSLSTLRRGLERSIFFASLVPDYFAASQDMDHIYSQIIPEEK